MSDFDDDMARGCLSNGESLEARWGTGYWSESPNGPEPDWDYIECPKCGKMAHSWGGQFVECEECGAKAE
jgi:hypothetical protein